MKRSEYDEILAALKDRSTWETKQLNWYNSRHTGVKRAGKPYPNAPDMHFPLADAMIDKLKAFYVQLIYAQDTLASFISKKVDQLAAVSSSVANWFDYQLKQRSNFEREVMIAVDQMLQNGHQIIKVRWDGECNRLAFDARDPMYVIVPKGTQELKDADWLIDVIPMSEAQYRANPNFNQDDDFVKSIKGRGENSEQTGIANKQEFKDLREGIGYSKDENTIIVWECYRRDRINKRITIETISPLLGFDGDPIRKQFLLPYNKGLFKSGERLPFMKFRTEIKDKGYYSERSIPEIVFQFEQLLNKTWNTQCTWMDYFSKPMFRATQSGIGGSQNIKSFPGAVWPFGFEPIDPPAQPQSLQEQMQFGRALAEYRVSVPDLGSGEHLTQYSRPEGKKTAREVSAVMDLSGMTNDVRSRVFRLDFGELLNLSWSIIIQFADSELSYVLQDEVMSLDQSALHDEYEINPNGSPDSWNKAGQLQKAMGRLDAFRDDPYIRQGELRKSVLEWDDPSLVKRLYVDPQDTMKDEESLQVVECLQMMVGFVPDINPSDDDKTHLMIQDQFAKKEITVGRMTPELAQAMIQHGAQHMGALMQKKDPMLKQIEAQLRPTGEALAQLAAQGQQPANVVQMQQSAGTPGVPPQPTANTAPQGPAGAAPNQDKPSAVMNALAALIKSGAPITADDISAALAQAGLPPIPNQPIPPPVQIPQTAGATQ